jgi:hypothetical protein
MRMVCIHGESGNACLRAENLQIRFRSGLVPNERVNAYHGLVQSASRLEPSAAVVGGIAAAAAVAAFRTQRGVLAGACIACASLRYGAIVPWLAFTIYNDKSWHPALESAEQLFMPWRREYRRGVDQTGRLSMLPGEQGQCYRWESM